MDNYHKLCKEYLEKIKPLLNGRSDLEYDTLVKLCGTEDAVTMADVKYRCEALFKKLQVHNDPIDIDTIVQYELSHEAEAEQQRQKEAEEKQRKAEEAARQAEEQQRQKEAEEKQRQEEAEEKQRQEEEKQRQAEEKQRQAAEAAKKQNLLNELNEEYINNNNKQLDEKKRNSIFSVFDVFKSPNMSDEEYAIVKTISVYIAKSTVWNDNSSKSLNKKLQDIKNEPNDLKKYERILRGISNINSEEKNSYVNQNVKFINLQNVYNKYLDEIRELRGNNRGNNLQNITNDTRGGMSFGGGDDYSDGRMALGGVMGGAILFSENAVSILMITCLVLLMYLIHILYYQPCNSNKNRESIYCGSLQNNEEIQYIDY